MGLPAQAGALAAVLALAALATASGSEQFKVVFNNPLDETVDIFWLSPDAGAKPSPMGEIISGGGMNINTFDGHLFGYKARSAGSKMKRFPVDEGMSGRTIDLPHATPGRKAAARQQRRKRRRGKRGVAQGAGTKGVGGLSFRNLADRPLVMFWKDQSQAGGYKFQGQIPAGGQNGFQTYPGHQFIWTEVYNQEPPIPLETFAIEEGKMIYTFIDDTTTEEALAALNEELDFRDTYFEKNGFDWIGTTWPRAKPTLWMHRPTEVGQTRMLLVNDTKAHQYTCSANEIDDCLSTKNRKEVNAEVAQQSAEAPELVLEVLSLEPRVFRIKNFVSEFEANYIMEQARPQLQRSTTGHGDNIRVDDVRTSKSAWLVRSHGDVMDAIYRRIGLAMNIPQELITENQIAENLNVLNYPVGGEYTPHYDVGADGQTNSRFISGLLYLNTPERGGGTSFPKAKTGEGEYDGIYVDAVKGSLVFFYDLLEDGNVDMRSLHSGTRVEAGEKWVSPLWLWEPHRDARPHMFGDLSRTAQGKEQTPDAWEGPAEDFDHDEL